MFVATRYATQKSRVQIAKEVRDMPDMNIASKMRLLSMRADARRASRPAVKSDADAKVENANFSLLKNHVYKEITKER